MQIVTLANETVLCEDCPLKGLNIGLCLFFTYLPRLSYPAKPESLKIFQTKSFPTRNYFQLFLVY